MPQEKANLEKVITFRVSPSEYAAAEAVAKREERRLADVIRRAFRSWLTRETRKGAK